MRIALLTDVHGNREAFDACRAEALRLGAEKFVYLGDFVGYGGDPAYIIDRVAEDFSRGALAVMGNHDLAVVNGPTSYMRETAQRAIEWTLKQLSAPQVAFLRRLPYRAMTRGETGLETLYVHGEASAPEKFIYVTDADVAEQSLKATRAHVTFCGHVHQPQLYHMAPGKPAIPFTPTSHLTTPLSRSRQWLGVMGSVGQPRDGDARAAFAIYDDSKPMVSYYRVDYDVDAAARKIVQAGLSPFFAERLFIGQ
jgi:diadenosine tetraphosphatase ApaH/serine/threonine PP2A family protein phosphatase